MSFLLLPPELHLKIVKFTAASSDAFDLLAVANTCQQLHSSFRPSFFDAVHKELQKNSEGTDWFGRLSRAPPQLILEYCSRYPEAEAVHLSKLLQAIVLRSARDSQDHLQWRLQRVRRNTAWETRNTKNLDFGGELPSAFGSHHSDFHHRILTEGSGADSGHDYDTEDSLQQALALLANRQHADEELVELICSRHATFRDGLLEVIMRHDGAWMLSMLLQYGAEAGSDSLCPLLTDDPDYQPLFEAIKHGSQDVVDLLIEVMGDPNATGAGCDYVGYSPIFYIMSVLTGKASELEGTHVYKRKLRQVELLVQNGGDIDCYGAPYSILTHFLGFDNGEGPVGDSIINASRIIPGLFKLGMSLSPTHEPNEGNIETSQYLYTRLKFEYEVRRPGLHGILSKFDASSYAGSDEGQQLFRWWIENGADLEIVDPNNGCTPLVHVVRRYTALPSFTTQYASGRLQMSAFAKLLVEAGASLEATDLNGFSPLVIAASGGKRDLLEILLPDQPEEVEKWMNSQAW
ncbi:hypothetical protein BJ508DRAFT_163900 [Ascobolus immersus RN42]|uniref:Uncharacterized protein n=1 Tax=Ascobolus immersus RN42 TaxID=1160509 RepID=A0A3N4HXF0_ASCIM|nr:hypothetical protein BJ508DRAFT_163900 [Ascobolus immersus RN42]